MVNEIVDLKTNEQAIRDLTDVQAIRAVKLFYDLTPPEIWEDSRKPPAERVKTLAAGLLEEAPSDMKPILVSLLEGGQPEKTAAQSEICRIILRQALQSPKLKPFADQAIETAGRPAMAIDPATGAFIIAMLIATSKIEVTPDGGYTVRLGDTVVEMLRALQVPKLVHELAAVIKALPKEIVSKLLSLS
jgi:hypothetical protein